MTARLPHLAAGFAVILAVVLGAAVLSARPVWHSLPADHGLLRLSFTTSGARRCRDRTPEELAALPRNMRQDQICERRRAPVYVELDLDGAPRLAATLPPGGLAGSGPSRVYRRFELPAGAYEVALRLRTDPEAEGFAAETRATVTLQPGQSVAIDYDGANARFVFDPPQEGE